MLTLPRDDTEKQETLSRTMKSFEKGREYSEVEVYEILRTLGAEDVILFARELVNFGYLGKNPYKSLYWVLKTKASAEDLARIKNWGKE